MSREGITQRKEQTTLSSVMKEKLMLITSFPLASAHVRGGREDWGGRGGGGGHNTDLSNASIDGCDCGGLEWGQSQ